MLPHMHHSHDTGWVLEFLLCHGCQDAKCTPAALQIEPVHLLADASLQPKLHSTHCIIHMYVQGDNTCAPAALQVEPVHLLADVVAYAIKQHPAHTAP